MRSAAWLAGTLGAALFLVSRAPAQPRAAPPYPPWTLTAHLPHRVQGIGGLDADRLWVGVYERRHEDAPPSPLARVEGAAVLTETLTSDGIVTDVVGIAPTERLVFQSFVTHTAEPPHGPRIGARIWEGDERGWSVAVTSIQPHGGLGPSCWRGDRLVVTGTNEIWERTPTGAWEGPRPRPGDGGAPCVSTPPRCTFGSTVDLLPGTERLSLVSCERPGATRYSVLAPDGELVALEGFPSLRRHLASRAVYVADASASLVVACTGDRIIWGHPGEWHVEWESRGALDCTGLWGVGRTVVAADDAGNLYRREWPRP